MRGSARRHVDKRGRTSWLAIWDGPPKIDPVTGGSRRVQKSKGGFRTQKDAQRFLNETLPRVAAGTYVEPSSESLTVFLRAWLAAQTNVKPLTANRYRQSIEGQIVPRPIGSIPLRQISPADVLAFLAELERCRDPLCDHRTGACRGLAVSSRTVIFAVPQESPQRRRWMGQTQPQPGGEGQGTAWRPDAGDGVEPDRAEPVPGSHRRRPARGAVEARSDDGNAARRAVRPAVAGRRPRGWHGSDRTAGATHARWRHIRQSEIEALAADGHGRR